MAITAHDPSILLRRKLWRGLLYFLVIALAVMFMFPYFWAVSSSLKAADELYLFPPSLLPKVAHPENYVYVLQGTWGMQSRFDLWMRNTVIITLLSTIGVVGSATIVSYAFARLDWPGRDLIFLLTLATLMLPREVTIIPRFLIFHRLGWLDTWLPLVVPGFFGGGAFDVFLLRQFSRTIPHELDEAAVIDGAGHFRILTTIIVPLMKPAIATLTLIHMVWRWSDFFEPLIYLTSSDKFPVSVGLRFFEEWGTTVGIGVPQDHYLMACCVMSSLPILVLFFFTQRYFVQGIVMTGLKA